ncbi:hypothetical protein BDV59DRAFT_196937 [Aspergillus ambiguus]|uniref:uncharacterized protein n=1 Tax=Aspergillus ambiguus TaxID=176160 RepID=UPI003CCC900D
MSAEYIYPPDFSDESDSDVDVTWAPGDGVCPSTAEFSHCWQSKRDDWRQASSAYREDFHTLQYYLDTFLNLYRDIKTTEDTECSQSQRSIDYFQCLGSPSPIIYSVKPKTQIQATLPVCTKPFRSRYFTSIVLAWSYIVSCHWAEILRQAGEESKIVHIKNIYIEDTFWDIVTHRSWRAPVKKKNATFFSP